MGRGLVVRWRQRRATAVRHFRRLANGFPKRRGRMDLWGDYPLSSVPNGFLDST